MRGSVKERPAVTLVIATSLLLGSAVFSGAQTSEAKARSSARSARQNQERADKIHW